jgi:cation transport regulator ChaC
VFQYGSNATSARLNSPSRPGGSAKDLGRAQTIDDFDIAFDVYSQTNGCAASDLVSTPGRKAWGVLYEIPDELISGPRTDRRKTLAQIEGQRYEEKPVRVRDAQGQARDAVMFVVKEAERRQGLATSAAYVSWIVYGLRDHGVPEEYLAHVVEVAAATNRRAVEDTSEQIRLIRTL